MNNKELVARLRGEYRIPITDGHGPAGGDEPDNAQEFVRRFPTTPIQREAADAIERLSAEVERLKDENNRLRQAWVELHNFERRRFLEAVESAVDVMFKSASAASLFRSIRENDRSALRGEE